MSSTTSSTTSNDQPVKKGEIRKSSRVPVLVGLGFLALVVIGGIVAAVVVAVKEDGSKSMPPPSPPPSGPLEILGSWVDNSGSNFIITPTGYYTASSVSTIVSHGQGYMIVRQGQGTDNPGSYQRKEWTWDATQTHWAICTVTYGHATQEAAEAAEVSGVHLYDSTNDKCGSTSNTIASPSTLAVAGSWVDNWGGKSIITTSGYYTTSSQSTMIGFGADFMILLQGKGTYSPGTYQRIEWTWDATQTNWASCTVTYGHETEAAVMAAEVSGVHLYNSTHDKCGTFSNTIVSPTEMATNPALPNVP